LQIRVSVFSKVSGSQKSAFLAAAVCKVLVSRKSAHVFGSKSFVSNLLKFPKLASWFSGKVLVSKWFHFTKSVFSGLRSFWQNQVSKIGFKVFRKSFGKFGLGFLARLIFSSKVHFS